MTPETEARANDLAEAHWNHTEGILAVHNVTAAAIAACGYHYKTAFIHGYKHALEDIAGEQRATHEEGAAAPTGAHRRPPAPTGPRHPNSPYGTEEANECV